MQAVPDLRQQRGAEFPWQRKAVAVSVFFARVTQEPLQLLSGCPWGGEGLGEILRTLTITSLCVRERSPQLLPVYWGATGGTGMFTCSAGLGEESNIFPNYFKKSLLQSHNTLLFK